MDATQDIEYQESLVFFANDDDCPDFFLQHFLQIISIIRMVTKRMVENEFFLQMIHIIYRVSQKNTLIKFLD